ncbi:MAG: [FeFe] hydrogenase H-cluster radical SAM maturase HydG [Deltaproteobacteria bacterium]|nr:[FeFe] hydrogenase H-cluster radical SAM maturase HydG [Deltaproteobacteria bacterium]
MRRAVPYQRDFFGCDGERLVLFAPLYVSDYCVNDCAYCNFHVSNAGHKRRRLSQDEIASEAACLINMGHKRVLLEFGEDPKLNDIDYICEAIRTIYSVKDEHGNKIRRVNVNIAATTVENYRKLKEEGIGTYQLFQETYHRPTYEALHKGPKASYDRQITAHNRAREAGLDDLGIGALFGLYDWKFEVMALVEHAQKMEAELGVGPHTISVPRFRPAPGIKYQPKYPVNDADFLKIIAILRIAVPYAGIILSTREEPALRSRAFQLGVSQASAASICVPGGYNNFPSPSMGEGGGEGDNVGQFYIQDTRPVGDVIKSILADGLIPSFCTACYRSGRTGEDFMDLAKPGRIHEFCRPNALLTFAEYLEDFGDGDLKSEGGELIEKYLNDINDDALRNKTTIKLKEIRNGARDLFF